MAMTVGTIVTVSSEEGEYRFSHSPFNFVHFTKLG